MPESRHDPDRDLHGDDPHLRSDVAGWTDEQKRATRERIRAFCARMRSTIHTTDDARALNLPPGLDARDES